MGWGGVGWGNHCLPPRSVSDVAFSKFWFLFKIGSREDIVEMATSSPASSSRGGDESGVAISAFNGSGTPQRTTAFDMPKPSLRGLNKPKCVKCGNVARSRYTISSYLVFLEVGLDGIMTRIFIWRGFLLT